jgi:glutaredoxin-like protein
MVILKENIKNQVKEIFKELKDSVKLTVFTQKIECPSCEDNRRLMKEISSLSGKIDIDVFNFVIDKEMAEHFNIYKIPATIVSGVKDYGIRFFGIPGGYEFTSFINSIKMVSSGETGLSIETKNELKTLKNPVHIQVFITLTCPYCSKAVQMAHEMAIESDLITSDMIDASIFPHLANRYKVFAVPKVIINEKIEFEGALPESEFLKYVMQSKK